MDKHGFRVQTRYMIEMYMEDTRDDSMCNWCSHEGSDGTGAAFQGLGAMAYDRATYFLRL
jgi:hypothetical protein